jgi:iron complex outermembrane receptor protein
MLGSQGLNFRARLVCGAAIVALYAGAAQAQSTDFALPAQPLSDSLMAVAQKTGESILFSPQALTGIQAPAVKGQMSARAAVQMLLQGTRLEAASVGSDGMVIRPIQEQRSELPKAFKRPIADVTPAVQLAQAQTPAPPATVQIAQAAPTPASEGNEQVIVSASRISIAGYSQPTPVTVVGSAQLEEAAHADIGDTIREMPQVVGSGPLKGAGGGTIFASTPGLSTVNLRNLGITRNLVLFDGQRVVQSNVSGGVDLSTIPSTLIQRVDVVTGGASAAYGSDAVSGVINLILNKNFDGFKANIQGSDTYKDDRRAYELEASYGQDIFAGRGHFIVSGNFNSSPDTIFAINRSWYTGTYLFNNPAYVAGNGQPKTIHRSNAGQYATNGGAIITGPLAGTQFVGPNGTPVKYDPGLTTGTGSVGGSSNIYNSEQPTNLLSYPFRSLTFFGYGQYRLTDNISASLQLNYGNSWAKNDSTTAFSQNYKIYADNAYLDPSIAARMNVPGFPKDTATGRAVFNLSTPMTNNVDLHHPSFNQFQNSIGVPVNISKRQLFRGVFTLDGSIGDNWSWQAYYQHGESRIHLTPTHIVVTANMTNALDAVRVTSGNVGTSGLQVGSIACRSTLTNPSNGCAPLNPFGDGVASAAAVNYVNTDQDFETMVLNEDVASGSMQGKLPWNLTGAGVPAVAFGAEYRKEGGVTVVSPLALATALSVANFGPLRGQYHIEEGFLEINTPVLKDSFVQSLDFDAAGRITSYSTSGMVETWKLGLTSQVNDDIKLRSFYSVDIRAPNLAELFSGGIYSNSSPIDPKTNKQVTGVLSATLSNPNLKPEVANTVSGGVVLTPHWIDGLQMSFDWYNINLKGFIAAPSAQLTTQLCQAGNQFYCNQFSYDSNGVLKFLYLQPQNAASLTTSGLDFQVDYGMPLFGGKIAYHLVGNYTDQRTQSAFGAAPFDSAGSLSSVGTYTSQPKLHLNISATYSEGPVVGTIQGRLFGSARLNNYWVTGVDVDDNAVPAVMYMDLRGSYRLDNNLQLYAAIDNVWNTPPPGVAILASQSNSSQSYGTDINTYDSLGRMFRLGLRLSY